MARGWKRANSQSFSNRSSVRSTWATKVSTIGQQALLGAKGAEESQGRKDHGIRRPWVHKAKCLIMVTKTEISKTLELATDVTKASDRSAARILPQAKLTYLPRPYLQGYASTGTERHLKPFFGMDALHSGTECEDTEWSMRRNGTERNGTGQTLKGRISTPLGS